MADSASTLEIQQRRALDAGTFAQQQASAPEPPGYMQRQAASLGGGLDGVNRSVGTATSGVTTAAPQPNQATAENASAGPIGRLQQMQKMRQQALAIGGAGTAQAINLANQSYARAVNIFQSELIANVLALEIIVSPWLFLSIFFMRVLAGLLPLKVKGLTIIPPYSLRSMGGIGVFISHLAATLIILTILFLILFLIMFVVWAMSEDPITQTQLFIDLTDGSLGAIIDLFTGS